MNLLRKSLLTFRILADSLIIVLAFYLTNFLFTGFFFNWGLRNSILIISILIITWMFSSIATFLYDEFRYRNYLYETYSIFKNVVIQGISLIVLLYFIPNQYPKEIVFIFPVILFPALIVEKQLLRIIFYFLRKKGINLRNILFVGVNDFSVNLYSQMVRYSNFGYNPIGFIGNKKRNNIDIPVIGNIDNLESVLNRNKIDDVVLSLPTITPEEVKSVTALCEKHISKVLILHENFDILLANYESRIIDYPILSIRRDDINHLHWRFFKRILDLVFTILLFIFIFSWLFPLVAILIKYESKGDLFFKQIRTGKNNKPFRIYKFRTMYSDSTDFDDQGNFKQARKNDSRITKIGTWLRKTSIDELPQFINILKGEMSLVGPRPHAVSHNELYIDKIQNFNLRHTIKPGLTGWAQIKGYRGPTPTIDLMQKRVEHDIWYINNWSFSLDIQIIILSIWLMLKGDKNAY
ncbi:MAG TPA: exopolysaccharide biosynthesis polyprenyl glycosylphosphotransferase [Melioribacteraceae bacterium]|nr:exopolysaccharide biosynthesis polyprenyl glycosylphosphotransferase [Melioribacteraceae bacterium]